MLEWTPLISVDEMNEIKQATYFASTMTLCRSAREAHLVDALYDVMPRVNQMRFGSNTHPNEFNRRMTCIVDYNDSLDAPSQVIDWFQRAMLKIKEE